MHCPECRKGSMIKSNARGMRRLQATELVCIQCGHRQPYPQAKAA